MHRIIIPIVLVTSVLFAAKYHHRVSSYMQDKGLTSLLMGAPTPVFSANKRFKRYNLSVGLLFAPRFDDKRGYKNTFPRLNPTVSGTIREWDTTSKDDAATTVSSRASGVFIMLPHTIWLCQPCPDHCAVYNKIRQNRAEHKLFLGIDTYHCWIRCHNQPELVKSLTASIVAGIKSEFNGCVRVLIDHTERNPIGDCTAWMGASQPSE